MGQHNRMYSVRNPNHTPYIPKTDPVLCLVCKGPSAMFQNVAAEGKKPNIRRLAKTMRRITHKDNPEKAYVHETPCLTELVRNWAKYIVDEPGLKALAKRENELSESAKQSNPEDAGNAEQGLGS